jgi:hypothetical protein
MRGMSMRDMKARQLGRAPRNEPEQPVPTELEVEIGDEEEPEEPIGVDFLVDQGDGMRVSQRRRQGPNDESRNVEYPDEPPPGWYGDGDEP